jgi:serine/threonine protein kinase/formylglycine-generating enzyme required for sulfatase activity
MAKNESKGAGDLAKQQLQETSSFRAGKPPATASQGGRGDTVAKRGSGARELPPQFGRYRVIQKLGGGGMGTVYLVENTELEREEALKVPHFSEGDDPQVRERFLREAKSAAKLDHANLCPVYDAGVQDGIYYLTMRLLKGKLLSDYTGKAQPERKAVEIVTKLALALEAAHAKGVIHRDLKPSNVMMVAGVGPVVMDFGLAKQVRQPEQKLTEDGAMLGTPAYMPPEQLKGELERMGPASDVYSLGVILYQLLTGRLPFEGTMAMIFAQILHTEPPLPSALVPGLNPTLDGICRKAMAKASTERYPSMKAFAAALLDFLRSAPATPGAGNLVPTAGENAAVFQAATIAPGPAGNIDIFQLATGAPPARSSLRPTLQVPPAARPQTRPTGDGGKSKRRIRSLAVSGACALLAIAIVLGAVGVFRLRTADGILVLEVNEPNPDLYVDGEKVTVAWQNGGVKAEVGVKPGTRKVELKKDGFRVYGQEVMLEDHGRTVLVARLDPGTSTAQEETPWTFKNSLGTEFVLVPKGKSWLGGGGGKPGDQELVIARDFYLSKYEVTQEEWKKVTGLTPSWFSRTGGGKDLVQDIADAELNRFPVENVSWDDVQKFLERLNAGEQKAGWVYRLPMAAEWEYACRGGPLSDQRESAYDFYCDKPTNQLLPTQANVNKNLMRTCKVGSYPPNRLGLCDMHGNVWEWCNREPRGGGWSTDPLACTAAFRRGPARWEGRVGLRLARSSGE